MSNAPHATQFASGLFSLVICNCKISIELKGGLDVLAFKFTQLLSKGLKNLRMMLCDEKIQI